MPRWMEFAEKTWGPKRTAAYDGGVTEEEIQRKFLDLIAATAFSHLRAHGNCCRSTASALQTHLALDGPGVFRASAAMAGGLAGRGEACGCVLGALMAIGTALGPRTCPDPEADTAARAAAATFLERFVEVFGHTSCRALQETLVGWSLQERPDAKAWLDADGPIACATLSAESARIAAEVILNHRKQAA